MMTSDGTPSIPYLMSRDEVAALFGIGLESVRSTLRRDGIPEERGYPRAQVEALDRRRRTPNAERYGDETWTSTLSAS